jgi:hypothetical protein
MSRQIVIVVDGGVGEGYIRVGPVETLAELLEAQQLGADYFDIGEVFALNPMNELKPVRYTVTGADDFDDEQRATAVVTVFFPDGGQDGCTYTVDGAA